jgi:hypothetical protein
MPQEFDELPIPYKQPSEVAAALRSQMGLADSATIASTQEGGAGLLFRYDANGNLRTGVYADPESLDGLMEGPGNIHLPDKQAIRWLKEDGTLSGSFILMWQRHDANGGEMILRSPYRMALILPAALQLGNNSSGLRAFHIHMVSGEATETRPIRWSPSVSFQTRTWSDEVEIEKRVLIQAQPTDATNANVVLRFFHNGEITQRGTNPNSYTANAGLATGDVTFEMTLGGAWHPGMHPASVELTDAATITQTCNKYKSRQAAHVTLTDDRALVISGAADGMVGTLLVSQDSAGGHQLTLPSNIITPADFELADDPRTTNRLDWLLHAGKFYMHLAAAFPFGMDPDAEAFLTRAGISEDETIELAINQLVLDFKAAEIFAKLHAVYPFAGGTATAHSKNLLADARHITWHNDPTHNANGITGDGTAACGVADFHFSSISGGQDSAFIYAYSRTQTPNTDRSLLGSYGGTNSARAGIRTSSNVLNVSLDGINRNSIGPITVSASSDHRKHFAGIRTASDVQNMWVNATKSNPDTVATTGVVDKNFGILCRNDGTTPTSFSTANLAMVAFGQALTDDEYAAFRSAVDTFQTALGRANP